MAKARIHVNRHVISANRKNNVLDPVLSMILRGRTRHAHSIKLYDANGLEVGEFVMAGSKRRPLSCGAVAWFEFDSKGLTPVLCDIDGNPIDDSIAEIAPDSYVPETVCVLPPKQEIPAPITPPAKLHPLERLRRWFSASIVWLNA